MCDDSNSTEGSAGADHENSVGTVTPLMALGKLQCDACPSCQGLTSTAFSELCLSYSVGQDGDLKDCQNDVQLHDQLRTTSMGSIAEGQASAEVTY